MRWIFRYLWSRPCALVCHHLESLISWPKGLVEFQSHGNGSCTCPFLQETTKVFSVEGAVLPWLRGFSFLSASYLSTLLLHYKYFPHIMACLIMSILVPVTSIGMTVILISFGSKVRFAETSWVWSPQNSVWPKYKEISAFLVEAFASGMCIQFGPRYDRIRDDRRRAVWKLSDVVETNQR